MPNNPANKAFQAYSTAVKLNNLCIKHSSDCNINAYQNKKIFRPFNEADKKKNAETFNHNRYGGQLIK